jgi:hypothetical protein
VIPSAQWNGALIATGNSLKSLAGEPGFEPRFSESESASANCYH